MGKTLTIELCWGWRIAADFVCIRLFYIMSKAFGVAMDAFLCHYK